MEVGSQPDHFNVSLRKNQLEIQYSYFFVFLSVVEVYYCSD